MSSPLSPPSMIEYREGSTPMVLESPHGAYAMLTSLLRPEGNERKISSDIPEVIANNVRFESEAVRRTLIAAVDRAAPSLVDLYAKSNRHGRVWTKLPRAFLDVNRDKKDVDELSVEGMDLPRNAHGSIWRSTAVIVPDLSNLPPDLAIEDMLRKPYDQTTYQALLKLGYDPYHNAVEHAMNAARGRHGFAVDIQVHTLPPHTAGRAKEGRHAGAYVIGPKAERGPLGEKGKMPDVIMIVNPDAEGRPQSCHPEVARVVQETLQAAGLIVSIGPHGTPFRGDFGSTVIHRNPAEQKHVVALEVVGHDGLEPGRIEGKSFEINHTRVGVLRDAIQRMLQAVSEIDAKTLAA